MADTLYEALSRIDPFVRLNDGRGIRTVEQILFSLDRASCDEYVVFSDEGRLLIYKVGPGGTPIRPAAFVEEKVASVSPKVSKSRILPA